MQGEAANGTPLLIDCLSCLDFLYSLLSLLFLLSLHPPGYHYLTSLPVPLGIKFDPGCRLLGDNIILLNPLQVQI